MLGTNIESRVSMGQRSGVTSLVGSTLSLVS